jgi:hypothetical protein
MDFTWVKRKDCKVLLQDSTLVGLIKLTLSTNPIQVPQQYTINYPKNAGVVSS